MKQKRLPTIMNSQSAKLGSVILCCLFLSACELLPKSVFQTTNGSSEQASDCVFLSLNSIDSNARKTSDYHQQCELTYWLKIWRDAGNTSWPERRQQLETLGNSPSELLHQFVLSQPIDTPYQVRLRAQSYFEQVRPMLSEPTASILDEIAYHPSQKLLEFESAITILSQVNTRQAKRAKEQAQLLQEQEEKINQLLKIEASIQEKNSER